MNKVVYVLGCYGFIGSYVTKACLEKGWYVRGIDKLTYASNTNLPHVQKWPHMSNFEYEIKDINDLNHLYECDYIINCAAETHVDNSIVGSKVFLDSNINGVHHLLELIKNKRGYKMPTLLHFSTDEVYGDIATGSHLETDILKPSNPYSATKAAADMLIQAWNRTYDIPYIIVRPTNNYGSGQYVEKLIPKTCKYLKIGHKIPLHNNGTPIRTWLHVEDTANAIIKIIESGVKNEIYNIGGNFETTNIYVVERIIQEYFGNNLTLSTVNDLCDFSINRQGQDIRYSLDDSKLRKLGWSSQKDFEQEIPNIVKYYQKNFVW